MSKKLSAQQTQEIIRLYQKGKSPKELGETFGIRSNSITRLLRNNGIKRTQQIKASQEEINQIIMEYTAGISSEVIAAKLKRNGSTICRILTRNNIAIRPACQNKRQYKINENFFEKIDTEDKSYFLGLMYADGNLSKNGNGIKITLQKEDEDILEKFSHIIYGFYKNYTYQNKSGALANGRINTYVTVPIYSNKMHKDLSDKGCPKKKTFIIRIPNNTIIPNDLIHHFVRGYFDGDGCISIINQSRPVIDFSSNLNFIYDIVKYLTSNGIECNKINISKKNPLSGSVQLTSRNNIINCYNLMYKDATIFLERKYNKFQDILKQTDSNDIQMNKYGTTYIPEFRGKILISDNVKSLSMEEKKECSLELLQFYREKGFPYSNLDNDEIIKDFNALCKINALSIEKEPYTLQISHQSGTNIFKHFSPHFYEVNSGKRGPNLSMLDTFNDDESLKKVILNRLNENFNITGNMIKQGLANSKLAYQASIFNTVIAKYIYTKFSKENDIIYDYSMGFGQRLTAALSLNHSIKYIGIDPMEKSVESNENIFSFFSKNIPMFNKTADIICGGSENYCPSEYEKKISLAFSSPPYYNLEKYENDISQANSKDYIHFINEYWCQTIENIDFMLKDDGIIALNIKDDVDGFNLGIDMCNVIREKGYSLVDTYNIQLSKNLSFGKKTEIKYEPIYIFKK